MSITAWNPSMEIEDAQSLPVGIIIVSVEVHLGDGTTSLMGFQSPFSLDTVLKAAKYLITNPGEEGEVVVPSQGWLLKVAQDRGWKSTVGYIIQAY